MNIKLRSAILFTVIVGSILLISYAVVYFLYANYKQDEFYLRLEQKALTTYRLLNDVKEIDHDLLQVIDRNSINALYDEKVLLFDTNLNVIYSSIDDHRVTYSHELLKKIEQDHIIHFSENDIELVGIYIKENGKSGIAIASAYDKFGKKKQQNLFYILLFSFIAAIILTAILSYFYVKQTFSPLDVLNKQIIRIGENRLNERVPIQEGGDELNQLAKNFNTMLDRLETSFFVQKSFIQHASHELRTPLANLVASCEAALNKDLSASQHKELLLSLNEEHKNLVSLTNALLLLSKYESMSDDINWPITRIDEALFTTIEEVQEQFPNHQIRFDYSLPPENEQALTIYGNEVLLRTAFSNLIRNACQYSANNHILINLSVIDNTIRIDVSNYGEGLKEKEVSILFHPFFRGENSVNKKGYGLGLAITQRILKLHQGEISYFYNPDKALNTFTVLLPAIKF